RTGYPFRKKPVRVGRHGCLLAQMKDLDAISGLLKNDLERIEAPSDADGHCLFAGDVLVASRGNWNTASVIVPKTDDIVIAAPNLLVVRIRTATLRPDFFAWWLNQPDTQEMIRARRSGSTIPFISIPELSDLKVPVPNVETQEKILKIHKLWIREQELLEEIKNKRRTFVQSILADMTAEKIKILKSDETN
ncbi:restriction endonuclease subunit S, partial [Pedosphaera parvula]